MRPLTALGPWLVAPVPLLALLACGPSAPETDPEAFQRLTNQGRAHLENREAAPAVEAFSAALAASPGSAPALRNLARAQLLAREHEAALSTLDRAREAEGGESAATAYLTGLTLARLSRFQEAVPQLEEAVRLDPASAPLRFQLANAYQAVERHQEAEEQLRETFRLDPLHATAAFRLARYAASRGDRQQAAEWNRRFAHLRQVLGEAGRSAEELEVSAYTRAEVPAAEGTPGEAPPPVPVRFTDLTAQALSDLPGRPFQAAAVLEVGEDGRPVLVAVGQDGTLQLLTWRTDGGGFETTPAGQVASGLRLRDLAVGDYYDPAPPQERIEGERIEGERIEGERFDPAVQARNDLFLLAAEGGRLLRRTGDGSFVEVTAEAGLTGVGGTRARWADVEQDGDLDLLVAGTAGLAVWQNRGDGTFQEVGRRLGVELAGPVSDLAAGDLDEDVAVDLLVARPGEGSLLLAGRREGRFAPRTAPPDPLPPAHRVLLGELDGDGTGDLVLVAPEAVTLLNPGAGRRRQLPLEGFTPAAAVLFDFDNDGALDLAVAGGAGSAPAAGRLRLWRNNGGGELTDATAETGLDRLALAPVTGLLAADLDGDGDGDLLLTTADGLTLLSNQGGDAHGRLQLRLVGTKANPSGIGTRVEVIAGAFSAVRLVDDPVVEIGVGSHRRLDAVRTVWTNGVVDNEIDLPLPDGPLTLVEKNVATGSCPFLYAWDGTGFRFVTDLLGNAPVGLPLSRQVLLPADPEELVLVGGADGLAPREGVYLLEVTSEFREVLYLDQARLLAVDHPPEVEIASPDKLSPPPFPPSVPWALTRLRAPRSAVGDDGVDRTAAVAARDGLFAPPGRLRPPPYRGATEPLALTLDFGPDGGPEGGGGLDPGRPLVLVLTGWLQYGDASTNIALSQNPSLASFPPRLEVETAAGWRPLPVTVGLPAGKTKTILVDLAGRLLPGARRLRLVTTHEVHWDRIALGERLADEALAGDVLEVHTLPPAAAQLRFRGFSELRSRAPGHPTTPEYGRVSPRPPWRTVLAGFSTRYGDVQELVAQRDGQLAIVNAGDALRLAFDASALPPVPPGRVRTFAFFSVGWDKDGDPNVAGGDRVEPLPAEAGLAPPTGDGGWQARWNTRWVAADRFARRR